MEAGFYYVAQADSNIASLRCEIKGKEKLCEGGIIWDCRMIDTTEGHARCMI